ncbi:MAG: filamentous hemagglutinin N-terminal domain-containing protein [Algisphaera sp.]
MLVPTHAPQTRRQHPVRRTKIKASLALSAVAIATLLAASQLNPASAAPRGGRVTAGEATISSSGNQTVINTTGQRTIIDYDSFNLTAQESVTFNQPNANAAVLNRIRSSGQTHINGTLLSNGQIYIVNPAGVTFGRDAVVNVGRLVAAAGTVTNNDFLAGIDHFSIDNAGQVFNYSNAVTGNKGVVFVGQVVANYGTLKSNGGTTAMVVGKDILLSEGPDGQIFARIKGFNDGGKRTHYSNVKNAGLIENPNGDVLIGAGDLFGLSVLREGMINTRHITLDTGSAPLRLSEPSSQFATISSNASITINTAKLDYYCDAAPNGRISLNAPGRFTNLCSDGDANCGPAFVNGQPFPLVPVTPINPVAPVVPINPNPLNLTSTFVDRYARQLPMDALALSGFNRMTADSAQRQALADYFGIETKGFEDQPLRDTFAASTVINDLSADPTDMRISSDRLSYGATQNALSAYDDVFGTGAVAGAGLGLGALATQGSESSAGSNSGNVDVNGMGIDEMAANGMGVNGMGANGVQSADYTDSLRDQIQDPRFQEAADRYRADQGVMDIEPNAFATWLEQEDPETFDALTQGATLAAGGSAGAASMASGEDAQPTQHGQTLDQTQAVRDRLQEAADRYMADQEVTDIDPDAFAAWLETEDRETLDALTGIDDLVNNTMPNLGLGASELDNFKQWTYGKIAPRGVNLRTLDELVTASGRRI